MRTIRIGTRESQLAVWQATQVKEHLEQNGFAAELVYIKSEGDTDLTTPLYEIGVQGIFTRTLDIALLDKRIDLAVHSMKDVPTQLPHGIMQAAVLKRGAHKDLLVFKGDRDKMEERLGYSNNNWQEKGNDDHFIIATSSIRRRAQWLHRYPHHSIENLRGNVNTRLRKLEEENWDAAIFAQAGLERIGLRPENSIELDWMLPAPAQGAIMVVCRNEDDHLPKACHAFHDNDTATCTYIEREFLRALLGGCSTPISALATISEEIITLKGNMLSVDGKEIVEVELESDFHNAAELGYAAAIELLSNGGQKIAEGIRNAKV